MNILFLVGNGLDLQYGLKTRYRDFYDYQIPKYKEKKDENYKNYIYEAIKKDKYNQYCNWSDLELDIGKISSEYAIFNKNKWGKFVEDFVEVGKNLYDYLKEQDENFNIDGKAINFEETLSNLPNDLLGLNSRKLFAYINRKLDYTDLVNIMTFNYTSVFDRLFKRSKLKIHNTLCGEGVGMTNIVEVYHAHGILGNNPIFGVSSVEQLSNLMDEEVTEEFIKEKIIENCLSTANQDNAQLINLADLIIIFGMSIGETDGYIWEKIARKSINSGIPIVIYQYNDKFDSSHPSNTKNEVNNVKDNFIKNANVKNMNLEEDNIKKLRDNILIAINRPIFEISGIKNSV